MNYSRQNNNYCYGCPEEWYTQQQNSTPYAEQNYGRYNDCDNYEQCQDYGYEYTENTQRNNHSKCRHHSHNNCRQKQRYSCFCLCGLFNCFRRW